jgi:hypothetical protein
MMANLTTFSPKSLLPVLLGCGLSILLSACGLWQPTVSGPAAPCSVAISKQAADRLLQRIDAQTKTKGKSITITATSQEITSLLSQFTELAKQETPGTALPIDHPVVWFANGKMSLFGQVNYMGVKSTALVTLYAAVGNGRAAFRVEQVDLGPVSVPQDLGALISALINDVLNQNLKQVQLTEVRIEQDQIRLSGQAR